MGPGMMNGPIGGPGFSPFRPILWFASLVLIIGGGALLVFYLVRNAKSFSPSR